MALPLYKRVARRVLLAAELRDSTPHLEKSTFDKATSKVESALRGTLSLALEQHGNFRDWLAGVSASFYVSGGDYRKGNVLQSGMSKTLKEALSQAESAYPDVDWSDIEDAVRKVIVFEAGRPPDKKSFVGKWDPWQYSYHGAFSAIANRAQKAAGSEEKDGSPKAASLVKRVAFRVIHAA